MKVTPKNILVAVAWPYVNGDIHLGHPAGYLLPADIEARYQRLKGNDVLMVSGSDCHGTPITVAADKDGVTPAEIVKKYHKHDLELLKILGMSYNLYTKTTTENHKRVTQEMFMQLINNGYISKGTVKQYYSPADEKFLPDRYVEGECPHCHAKGQRSDQCENCGRWLADGELINPYSKLTNSPVELRDTEHYFLDFEKLSDQLKAYVATKKDIWRNWVWAEADGWLREGLQKRAITRDMDWAIPLPIAEIEKLPKDLQLDDLVSKRIYVWFEAVIGYLSAPQEWSTLTKENEQVIFKRYPGQSTDWHDWWTNPQADQYYFVGQDNLIFHCLMWQAQLIGAKQNYTLPNNVVVSKFLNYEGQKFSKSRDWIIDSRAMVEKYGLDAVRYYIAANFPENKEGNFTWEGFVDSTNSELVGNFGNFINRTLKFLESKYGGKLAIEKFAHDFEVKQKLEYTFKTMGGQIGKAEFVAALNTLMELTRFGNQYFDKNEIWKTIKTDQKKSDEVMLNLLTIIANLPVLMEPFLPTAAAKLAKTIGLEWNDPVVGENKWVANYINKLELTETVNILFEKLDKETVLAEKV